MLLTAHKLLSRSSLTAAGPCLDYLDLEVTTPGPLQVRVWSRLDASVLCSPLPSCRHFHQRGARTSDTRQSSLPFLLSQTSEILVGGAAALSAGALVPVCSPGGCPIPGEQNGRTVAPGLQELGLLQIWLLKRGQTKLVLMHR